MMTTKRRNPRQRLVDALEAERLRPVPRRDGSTLLRCQWAPRCGGIVVAWADDPEGTGWLPVCGLHRAAAEDDGVPTAERL